jgi:hypothetical protein
LKSISLKSEGESSVSSLDFNNQDPSKNNIFSQRLSNSRLMIEKKRKKNIELLEEVSYVVKKSSDRDQQQVPES